MALSDGTQYQIPKPQQGDDQLGECAAGNQSNVRDLSVIYKALVGLLGLGSNRSRL